MSSNYDPNAVPQQTDLLSSPLAQLLVPLAAVAASAVSPRYGAPAAQAGLGALGAMQQYRAQGARIQDLLTQQKQHAAALSAVNGLLQGTEPQSAGGNVPGSTSALQTNVVDSVVPGSSDKVSGAGSRNPTSTPVPNPGTPAADLGDHFTMTPEDQKYMRLQAAIGGPEKALEYYGGKLNQWQTRERAIPMAALPGLDTSRVPAGMKLSGKLDNGASFEYQGQKPFSPTNPFEAQYHETPNAPVSQIVEQSSPPPKGEEAGYAAYQKREIAAGRTPTWEGYKRIEAQATQLPPQVPAEDAAILREHPGWTATDLAQFKGTHVTPEQLQRTAASLLNPDPDSLVAMKDVVGRGAATKAQLYDMASQMAAQRGIKFSPQATERKLQVMDSYASGPDAKNLQSFGTFLEHAGALKDASDAFPRSDVRLLNTPISYIAQNLSSDPRFTTLIAAMQPVRDEYNTGLLDGKAAHDLDKKAMDTIMDDRSTVGQVQAALNSMGHTIGAKFNETNFRYKRTVGRDISFPFSPEALTAAKKIGLDLGGGSGSGGGFKMTATGPNGAKIGSNDGVNWQPIQ